MSFTLFPFPRALWVRAVESYDLRASFLPHLCAGVDPGLPNTRCVYVSVYMGLWCLFVLRLYVVYVWLSVLSLWCLCVCVGGVCVCIYLCMSLVYVCMCVTVVSVCVLVSLYTRI